MVVSHSWLRVHLAQSFVALDRLALARLIEEPAHGFLERADIVPFGAAHHVRALADQPDQRAPEIRDPLILGGLEELARQEALGRRAHRHLADADAGTMALTDRPILDAIGARAVIERVEPVVQGARPVADPLGVVEVRDGHFQA